MFLFKMHTIMFYKIRSTLIIVYKRKHCFPSGAIQSTNKYFFLYASHPSRQQKIGLQYTVSN